MRQATIVSSSHLLICSFFVATRSQKARRVMTYASRRQCLQTRAQRPSVDLDRCAKTARNISSGIELQASAPTQNHPTTTRSHFSGHQSTRMEISDAIGAKDDGGGGGNGAIRHAKL